MKVKYLILGFLLLINSTQIIAQTRQVTGVVRSAKDGLTLPGITVQAKDTLIGVSTDLNGNFTINVPETTTTLVFSGVGLKTKEVIIDGRSSINIVLEEDAFILDEIVVIAYGTSRRGTYTGAVTSVTSQKIESRPVANVSQAIEGLSPGVQVTSGTGQPGDGPNIRIRGFGSINASSDPLYIVDGVPYTLDISNINPNDVESISILKDATATALYGNKAANGVVIITTKSGTRDRSQFQVNVRQGISTRGLPEYDLVGPKDWVKLNWIAYVNQMHYSQGFPMEDARLWASGIHPTQGSRLGLFTGSGGGLLGYNPFDVQRNDVLDENGQIKSYASLIYSNKDLDWQKAMMQLGTRNEYNILYSGGTDKTNYFSSIGYLRENGYLIRTDFERLSARLNVSTQPIDWFKTGTNISANMSMSETSRTDGSTSLVNPFFFSRNMGPIYPIYAQMPITGEYMLDDNGEKIYDLGNMIDIDLPFRPSGAYQGRHALAETMFNQGDFRRSVISGRVFAEVKFSEHLTLTTNASVDLSLFNSKAFDNPIVGDGAPAGRARRTSTQTTSYTFNQLLNYSRTFKNIHSIDVLVGHENYDYTYNYFFGAKQGIILDGNFELINFTDMNSLNSFQRQYRNEGYFTRVNYGYDEKYFVSGSYRRDGSSRFYTDSRWGNFWSAGIGWRMDREEFLQLPQINMMVLRASYGQVGNDGLDSYYPWQALYQLNRNNANEPGYYQQSLPAFDLTWESNNSYNVGMDFGFFQRVRGNIEWFHRASYNLLFAVPLPVSSGIDSEDKNIGAMYNQGIELRVATDIIENNDFIWTIDLNATTVRNKITKMPGGPDDAITLGTRKLMEGRSMYDFWLRQWYGVDPEDGLSLYHAENTDIDRPDIRVIGNDTLTTSQANARYGYSGSAIPNLVGGISNTGAYKNWELSILMTYQVGGRIYDAVYRGLMTYDNWGRSMHTDLMNAWTEPGQRTDVPRLDPTKTDDNNAISSRWLIDGSFLSLRSINLTYTVPENLASRINANNIRVYVTAENLFLISKRKGMNVQQSFAGVTSNDYSPSRIFTLGINLSF